MNINMQKFYIRNEVIKELGISYDWISAHLPTSNIDSSPLAKTYQIFAKKPGVCFLTDHSSRQFSGT